MSDKQFILCQDDLGNYEIRYDDKVFHFLWEVAPILNEQQDTIKRMKHSLNTIYKAFEKHYGYDMRNAVWLIDELSYDEIVDELYIAETDSKNRKEASMYWKKKVDEQQSIIQSLKEENEQLQQKLKDIYSLKGSNCRCVKYDEKRFTVDNDGIYDTYEKKHFKFIAYDWMECDIYECCEKLNEQQDKIQDLEDKINKLPPKIREIWIQE